MQRSSDEFHVVLLVVGCHGVVGDMFDPTVSLAKFHDVLKKFVETNREVLGQGNIPFGKIAIVKFFDNSARSRPSGRFSMADFFDVLLRLLES